MIEAIHLSKRYGEKYAVNDISFTVKSGEIVGLLGPNGAGKSTILGMITGYVSPSSGEVLIDGVDLLEEPYRAKRKIGYLPETPPIYPDMTINEQMNFAFDLKKLDVRKRKIMIEEACSLTQIENIRGRLIRNLSKGLKQRVGLAQALLGNPEVLLLDEPGEGLDPRQNLEIREVIRDIGAERTVVFSSHILSEVSALCQKILVLNQGKLIANGDLSELMNNMQGPGNFTLVVAGEEQQLRNSLQTVPGLVGFDIRESEEDGCWNITLTAQPDYDPRRDVFYAMAKHDCPILLFKPAEHSLEELFMQLLSQ